MSYYRLKSLGGCKPLSPRERFEQSFLPEPNSGCWLWLGRERGSYGYGAIKVNGRHMPAHRYSYEINCGEIPSGLLVLHRCDTPACVNPEHLFIGTSQDNSDDKVAKGRQARGRKLSIAQRANKARGHLNRLSKLSEENAIQIRYSKEPQRKLAAQFRVSQTTIWKIKTGKAYA